MYKEAIVNFKDGTKYFIPINSKEDIKYYDNIIIVYNGYHSYEFNKYETNNVEIIDIEGDLH